MPRISPLGYLARTDPPAARKAIVEAFATHAGDAGKAAASFGLTRKALYNQIENLRAWPDIEKAERAGRFSRHRGPARVGTVGRFLRSVRRIF